MRRNIICLISIAFLFISNGYAEKKIIISLKGGFHYLISSTYNNEFVPPINQLFTYFYSELKGAGLSPDLDKLDEIRSAITYGSEIEFLLTPEISFALDIEYWKKSPMAFTNASGNIGETSFHTALEYNLEISLIPVITTIRFSIPREKFRLYAGGGVGYYFGKIKSTWKNDLKVNEVSYSALDWKQESSGNSIMPHINIGVDYNIAKNLAIAADFRFPLGTIKSFKIKKDNLDQEEVGKEFSYSDSENNVKSFKWELSGINFGIFLKIKF